MLKSEAARRSLPALWFAIAAAIPVGLYFSILPLSSGWAYLIINTVVPILAAGIGGAWLGAGILDEKKTKSWIRAAGRGLAIAALSYLILFVVELIIIIIYNSDAGSDEILRDTEMIAVMFSLGLLFLGWLIALVGAAAGGLLYFFRLKMVKAGEDLSPTSNNEAL